MVLCKLLFDKLVLEIVAFMSRIMISHLYVKCVSSLGENSAYLLGITNTYLTCNLDENPSHK